MKKNVLVLMCIMMIQVTTLGASMTKEATPTYNEMFVDGKNCYLQGYTIDGTNYYKLRDIAWVLEGSTNEFSVNVDGATGSIRLGLQEPYVHVERTSNTYWNNSSRQVAPTKTTLLVDGKQKVVETYVIEGSTYFKLRDLGEYIGFGIGQDAKTKVVTVHTQPAQYTTRLSNEYFTTKSRLDPTYRWNWEQAQASYVFDNKDGTVTYAVAEENQSIILTTFDNNLKLVSKQSIPYELPIFGGLTKSEGFYYAIFGRGNKAEVKGVEVYRIVKYDNQGKKLGSISLTGEKTDTTIPFDAGCTRMAISGDQLIIYTSRERLKSADGLNHQSNMTFEVDTKQMTLKSASGSFPMNHVSHSFNQFVQFDGNTPVFVDHGDAYPRSVALKKGWESYDLLPIKGAIGNNYTGVEVGGFEISDTHYLVAGISIDQSKVAKSEEGKRLFVATLAKESGSKPQVYWLTEGEKGENISVVTNPKLVKVDGDRFVLLWKEGIKKGYQDVLRDLNYVLLDAKGEKIGKVETLSYSHLSECDPIIKDGNIMWLTHDQEAVTVYQIPLQ